MLVWHAFRGDDNKYLGRLQTDCYPSLGGLLFRTARDRYLAAVELVEVRNDELADRLRPMEWCDHRPLQESHDLIAAYYRHVIGPACQMEIGEDAKTCDDRFRTSWQRFYEREVNRLVTKEAGFTRTVCRAAAFAHTEIGFRNENLLRRFLKWHYGEQGLWAWRGVGDYPFE